MAARSSEVACPTRCRALVGGFGVPGLRDLDFGRLFVEYIGQLDWPDDVVVEDLSHAAPLVLHRLQELHPAKVVLIGAAAREPHRPGTVRRYRPEPGAGSPTGVHAALASALGGMAGIDHTLTVVRHWGALPSDTVVIEVEPVDTSLGLGFSEQIGTTIEPVLSLVREELGTESLTTGEGAVEEGGLATLGSLQQSGAPSLPPPPVVGASVAEPDAVAELVNYGRFHERVSRTVEILRRSLVVEPAAHVEGLSLAARLRPAGGLGIGGDWYDVMPVGPGWTGVVVGDVPGCGLEAGAVMSQVRAAARACALVDGTSATRVVAHLDRVVNTMGIGELTTLLYLAVHPGTGELRLASAGHCPPLLVAPNGTAEWLEAPSSPPLGTAEGVDRPEARFTLSPGSTVLAYTDGLVEGRKRAVTEGLAVLRRAAANGPRDVEALCDHVLTVCTASEPRGDDMALVALRRGG